VTLETRRAWIEPLVQSLARPAFEFAMGLTRDAALAEEIVQEAFVRLWQAKSTPREAPAFRSFLYKTVLNLVRDHRRRQSRWERLRFWLPAPTDPAEQAERRVGDAEVARALTVLSARERKAVYLRFFEDASYEEMARIMGARESTMRVLVHRALAKLRPRLKAQGMAPERSNT
jgi:RNA polymerase sigma-70 factor (ECF subfamily)